MSIEHFLILLVIGVIAGFINVVAGGGSLLTLPFLILFGLPSSVANGTNRIAILIQNLVAISRFRKNGHFEWKYSLLFAVPAAIGSIIGAHFAIDLPDKVYNRILSLVMILVIVIMILQPYIKNMATSFEQTKLRFGFSIFIFFLIGIYGGFIQAGVGFVIIIALTFTGMSLVNINSIKVFVIAGFLLSSLVVFIINNQVNWGFGFTLALGTSIGAFFGSNFAVNKSEKWIRIVMIILVVLMAIKLWISS